MFRCSIAGRRHIDLSWVCLGIGDEFGTGFGRKRWMHSHDVWDTADAGDWNNVADKIEVELLVESRVDRVIRSDEKKRIAVRRCLYDRLGADIAAGTRPVVNDKLLAESLRQ